MTLALAWQIGLPQGLLQTVAWGLMLTSYSQESGFGEGLKKTFDGQHPCSLCERIAQTRPDSTPTTLSALLSLPADFLWVLETVTGRISNSREVSHFSLTEYLMGADRASPLLPLPEPKSQLLVSWKPRLRVGFHLRFNPLVQTLGSDFPARLGGKQKDMNWITKFILMACAILAIAETKALAHISYTGRNFGTLIINADVSNNTQTVSSGFGWADATDADWGDSHRGRFFRFTLASPLEVDQSVRITVERNLLGTGAQGTFLSAFSFSRDWLKAPRSHLPTIPAPCPSPRAQTPLKAHSAP